MDKENIIRWFQDTAERRGTEPCLRFKKDKRWHVLNWIETLNEIKTLSEALKKEGVSSSGRVALLSNTRYEWTLIDMAILSLGAVTVPIYHSVRPEDILHILKDSEADVIFVEDAVQLEKILQIKPNVSTLKRIILIEGESSVEDVSTFQEFRKLGLGVESDFGSRIREISHENLATLVYTSGTTGPPKGVMLSHGNIVGENLGLDEVFPLTENSHGLCFLPLAHILARVVQFYQLAKGFTHSYAESIEKLVDNLSEVRPDFMVSVPRIFEKIYQKTLANVEASSSAKKKIFYWAKGVGREYSQHLYAKKPVSLSLRLRYALAFRLVFSKLHQKLGGRFKFFVSGGAPLSQEIAEFFHGAGLMILEGYGLTETTAAINANRMDDFEFGTVGKPILGAEEKIAEDGEILVRGPMVAKGYWKKPEASAESFDNEGWFHSGDIGEFTAKGNLRITDRKKDIIVTAGGKNIAPQNLENVIKTNPLISQVVVHGDRRKYLTALITLDPEHLKECASALGLKGKSTSELVQEPSIYEEVKKIIDENNKHFAKYETIKRFVILDKDFSIEDGELTPTLKVKRKIINERYRQLFDKLYQE